MLSTSGQSLTGNQMNSGYMNVRSLTISQLNPVFARGDPFEREILYPLAKDHQDSDRTKRCNREERRRSQRLPAIGAQRKVGSEGVLTYRGQRQQLQMRNGL